MSRTPGKNLTTQPRELRQPDRGWQVFKLCYVAGCMKNAGFGNFCADHEPAAMTEKLHGLTAKALTKAKAGRA